jgi:hypothetical protein
LERNRIAGTFAAQIEVAVLQPSLFTGCLVELERKRCALPQYRQPRRVDLDGPGGNLRVLVALGSDLDDALDRDAELGAQPVSGFEYSAVAEHHLRHPGRVAQVNEDHAAVVAATRDPAGQRHLLTGVGGS